MTVEAWEKASSSTAAEAPLTPAAERTGTDSTGRQNNGTGEILLALPRLSRQPPVAAAAAAAAAAAPSQPPYRSRHPLTPASSAGSLPHTANTHLFATDHSQQALLASVSGISFFDFASHDHRRSTSGHDAGAQRPASAQGVFTSSNSNKEGIGRARDDATAKQAGKGLASKSVGSGHFSAASESSRQAPNADRSGAKKRDLGSEDAWERDDLKRQKRAEKDAEKGSRRSEADYQTPRKKKKVRFMTDELIPRPTQQYGDNRSQAMDVQNASPTPAGVTAAGSSAAVGAAAQSSTQTTTIAGESQNLSSMQSAVGQSTGLSSQDPGQISQGSSPFRRPPAFRSAPSIMEEVVEYNNGAQDPLARIGREQTEPIRPHPTQHLISLYGLTPLAASVARYHPITGEKINRLRKSYEGHTAKLGISGRNKQVKHEPDPQMKRLGLEELVHYPAEEWHIQHESKVPLKKGWNGSGSWDIGDSFRDKLEKAMKFEALAVPSDLNAQWEGILGHEKPRVKSGKQAPSKSAITNGPSKINGASKATTPAAAAAAGISRTGTPANDNTEASRPRRAGKKRRYNDNSFVGYGEGFVDDDDGSEGVDSSNEGSRNGRKKRRKDSTAGPPPRPQGRMGSYGPGMIHSAGIGTIGR